MNINKKKGYIAAALSEESTAILQQLAKHECVYCHHMTIIYEPNEIEWRDYEPLLGSKIDLQVVGVANDQNAQAVRVEGFASKNTHPHITISCRKGIPPRYCKTLFDRAPLEPLRVTLGATIEFVHHQKGRR